MSRFIPYLGIIAGLALGILVIVLFDAATAVAPSASSKLSILIPVPATSAQAISTQKKITAPKNNITPATTTPSIEPASPAAPVITPPPNKISLDASATALRGALVNIICTAPAGSKIRSISGSGIIIDPKGIILTNAHVAQYFLLTNRGVSCAIRSGGPAIDRYDAALIYISPAWLRANPNVLTQTAPSGTGEYDFALLAISRSTTSDSLPHSFPSLPLATMPPVADTPVVIASYGAQFLTSNQITSDLFPTVVFGSVKSVFTFRLNTIDILALGGSAAAQEGSSGGGVADASGNLVGTITTSTVSGATDTRELNAITASYIRAEYATEMGSALDLMLAQPTSFSIADFAPQLPVLEKIITANL